jgi:precorrin-6B methylase 2
MILYNSIGKQYNFTRKADPRIVDQIINLLNLPPKSLIADVGAGTGNYSNALAGKGSNETVQNWTTLAKRAFLLSINLVLLSISSSFCLPRTKN